MKTPQNCSDNSVAEWESVHRDIIGDPPNSIMRMQLLRLWKEVLGSEDVGDFRTFMKEAADLTYDEARPKAVEDLCTPERIQMKDLKDVEEAFHA